MATKEIELKYLQWQDLYNQERPFQLFIDIPPDAEDQRVSNLVFEKYQVKIKDVRGIEDQFSVDANGFMFANHKTHVSDFTNRENVEDVYFKELEMLLREKLEGVDRCFFFNWRLRDTKPEIAGEIDINDPTDWRRPATHLHVDQSPSSVLNRIKGQFPTEAEFLLKGRVRVVNVWRPLVEAVQDWPLALCDGKTVDFADLIETDHIQKKYTGPTMYMTYSPNHRFYYLAHQNIDEVIIFKNFDSEQSVCRYAPHAAFKEPSPKESSQPRKSIEVRALLFTYADSN